MVQSGAVFPSPMSFTGSSLVTLVMALVTAEQLSVAASETATATILWLGGQSSLGDAPMDDTTGAVTSWVFGSPSGVPVPADYDGDGRLDLAYWEPDAREIRVSFTRGRSVDRVIPVPPDALPIFVNMY